MSKKKSTRKNNDSRRLNEFGDTGHKLTQKELESHLWESANILRGSIDAADYKNYIFGLLFLKRLSDVFGEEAERIEAETGDKELAWEDPDEHAFFVPSRARWSELRKISHNVGEEIDKANEALELANLLKLEKVLTAISYNDKDRLPDATLLRLIDHFSKYRLRDIDLSDSDMLGRAYEFLIGQFADDAGKKGGEFYTPKKVVELLVRLIKPEEGMRICDPTCGSGGMLIECARYIKERGKNPDKISLYGQEKNISTWAICKMNLLLHKIYDFRIEREDTLSQPKLLKGGELIPFERVIANPPFSLENWDRESIEKDGYGRFQYGIPPKSYAELAFVQHMLATTTRDGIVGVVQPHGVLFRSNAEAKIRRGFIEDDLLEAVIGLPPNLFYGTGISGCILIFSKSKLENKKGKVLFIAAESDYQEGRAQNFLRDEDIKKIVTAFEGFEDIDRYCRVVDISEIKENDFNLSISRYVDTSEPEKQIDIEVILKEIHKLRAERHSHEAKLDKHLSNLGFHLRNGDDKSDSK